MVLHGHRYLSVRPMTNSVRLSTYKYSHDMQDVQGFRQLPDDLVASSKRWLEWMDLPRPEEEPLPGQLAHRT